jgi:hypothetical protein
VGIDKGVGLGLVVVEHQVVDGEQEKEEKFDPSALKVSCPRKAVYAPSLYNEW